MNAHIATCFQLALLIALTSVCELFSELPIVFREHDKIFGSTNKSGLNRQIIYTTEHRTNAASEKANELWCYQCDTMEDGEKCSTLSGNYSSFEHKCVDDKRICMVKRVSYSTSTENSTSSPQTWSLERHCTNKCEPGCIVIGERTKLYACTACCENDLCNTGTGTANDLTIKEIDLLLALVLQIVVIVIMYPS